MDDVNDPTFDSLVSCSPFYVFSLKDFIQKLNFKTNEIVNVGHQHEHFQCISISVLTNRLLVSPGIR